MQVNARCFATYLSNTKHTDPDGGKYSMRQSDWDAFWFRKAIKAEDMKTSRVDVPIGGGNTHRINNGNRTDSWDLVANFAAANLAAEPTLAGKPFKLVPVPSSEAWTGGSPTTYAALEIANRVAAILRKMKVNATVWDGLRWTIQKKKSRQGGSRNASQLLALLTNFLPVDSTPCVLIDDALATGAHLLACGKKLIQLGAPVTIAVCGIKALQAPAADPFAIHIEDVRDIQGLLAAMKKRRQSPATEP